MQPRHSRWSRQIERASRDCSIGRADAIAEPDRVRDRSDHTPAGSGRRPVLRRAATSHPGHLPRTASKAQRRQQDHHHERDEMTHRPRRRRRTVVVRRDRRRAPARAAPQRRDAGGPECRRSGPSTARRAESRAQGGRDQTRQPRQRAASLSSLSVFVASRYSCTQRSITAEVFSTLVN